MGRGCTCWGRIHACRQKGKGKGKAGKRPKGWGLSDECFQSLLGSAGSTSAGSTSMEAPKEEEDADEPVDAPMEFTVSVYPAAPAFGTEARPPFVHSFGVWLRENFTEEEIRCMLPSHHA